MKTTLIGVDAIREIVATAILTGRVTDARPVSVLLIAKPEYGKTSAILEQAQAILSSVPRTVLPITDVTGRGLIDMCRSHPNMTHFALLDLVMIMSHRASVNSYTLAVILALTEEGVKKIGIPGGEIDIPNGQRGILAATTPGLQADNRRWWNANGLSSRLLPICYAHSSDLETRIKKAIQNGGQHIDIPNLRVPTDHRKVRIGKLAAQEIANLANERARKLGEVGYRLQKQYRIMAQGHALLKNGREVRKADLDFLKRMDMFVSYKEARQI